MLPIAQNQSSASRQHDGAECSPTIYQSEIDYVVIKDTRGQKPETSSANGTKAQQEAGMQAAWWVSPRTSWVIKTSRASEKQNIMFRPINRVSGQHKRCKSHTAKRMADEPWVASGPALTMLWGLKLRVRSSSHDFGFLSYPLVSCSTQALLGMYCVCTMYVCVNTTGIYSKITVYAYILYLT